METCEKCGSAGKVRKFTDADGAEARIGVYCDKCLSGYLIDVYSRSSVGGRLTPRRSASWDRPSAGAGTARRW